jgi:hypothetical protein
MRSRIVGLAVSALLLCTTTAYPATTQDVVDQVTLPEYMSYLRVLSGVDAVPGSPPTFLTNRSSFGVQGRVAAQWMQEQMANWGLAASLDVFDPAYAPNVVGEKRGTTRPDDIYIIAGHYDTYIENGSQWLAPGCDDNGSGTAAVLLAARILSQYEFEGTLRFLSFSGEEQWMVGSQAYANAARAAGENIAGVINLDMILHPGFDNQNPNPDYDLDISAYSSEWLGAFVAARFAQYTSINTQVNAYSYNNASDHWSFWINGYAALELSENTTYEIWGGSNDIYHHTTDTIYNPDNDWDFAIQAVRGGLASLTDLAVMVPEPAALVLLAPSALVGCRRRRS